MASTCDGWEQSANTRRHIGTSFIWVNFWGLHPATKRLKPAERPSLSARKKKGHESPTVALFLFCAFICKSSWHCGGEFRRLSLTAERMFFGARPTVGAPVSTQNVRGVHNADFTMYRPQLGRSWLLGTWWRGGGARDKSRWSLVSWVGSRFYPCRNNKWLILTPCQANPSENVQRD